MLRHADDRLTQGPDPDLIKDLDDTCRDAELSSTSLRLTRRWFLPSAHSGHEHGSLRRDSNVFRSTR